MAKSSRKIKLQPVPGTPNEPQRQPDASREYVPGIGVSFAQYGTVLPNQPHTEECLSPEIYRQMLHDPEVSANLWLLVNGTLADGAMMHPQELAEDDPRAKLAAEIAAFHQRNIDGLPKPLTDILEKLLKEAIQYGHKVAEQTFYIPTEGPDAGRARHRSIKVKSRQSVSFVIDAFWNVLGLTANQAYSSETPTIIPREKFVVISLREEDEDPRGMSWLRSAVNGWQFKCGTWPQWYQFLDRCGIPGLVGECAPKGADQVLKDSSGNVLTDSNGRTRYKTPQEALSDSLVAFRSASVIAVPNGSNVTALEVTATGEVFDKAIDVANSEITRGMLYQVRATNESQFGSRADSQTGYGILEGLIWYLKGRVAWTILNDILRPVHLMNFPADTLDLMPSVSLGDSDRRDWAKDADAVTSFYGKVSLSQWLSLLASVGVPAPEEGEDVPYPQGPMMPPNGQPGNNNGDPMPDNEEE